MFSLPEKLLLIHKHGNYELKNLLRSKHVTWNFLSKNVFKSFFNNDNCFFNIRLLKNKNLYNLSYNHFISGNPNIPLWYIEKNINKNWDWHCVFSSPNVTLDFIEKNFLLHPQRFSHNLCYNTNVTIEFMLDNPHIHYDMLKISQNLCISISDIITHNHMSWNYDYVSDRPDVTIDIIRKNPDFDWSYVVLSQNRVITMKNITDNLDLDWNFYGIAYNINITIDFIKKYIIGTIRDNDIFWYNLSFNKKTSDKMFTAFIDKPRIYYIMSANVTIDIIKRYPEFKWNSRAMSQNRYITYKIIKNNNNTVNWEMLAYIYW